MGVIANNQTDGMTLGELRLFISEADRLNIPDDRLVTAYAPSWRKRRRKPRVLRLIEISREERNRLP
jgi:hypothetical protein